MKAFNQFSAGKAHNSVLSVELSYFSKTHVSTIGSTRFNLRQAVNFTNGVTAKDTPDVVYRCNSTPPSMHYKLGHIEECCRGRSWSRILPRRLGRSFLFRSVQNLSHPVTIVVRQV